MTARRRTGSHLFALAALSATIAFASLPPFDFTGTWTGTATTKQGQTAGVAATFTSTGPRTFTGALTLESVATCEVNGKYGRPVKLHLKCEQGRRTLRARLDLPAQTLHGAFRLGGQRVMYTLTKNAA